MRKCPKCGADNSPARMTCAYCNAPFAAPQEQQQGDGQTPYRPAVGGPGSVQAYRPAVGGPGMADSMVRSGGPLGGSEETGEVQTVVGKPLGSSGSTGYQGPPPGAQGGPQTDIYGAVHAPSKPKYRELGDAVPVKNPWFSTIVMPLLTLLGVLAIGAFVYWKFILLPSGPMKVMREYVPAAISDNVQGLQGLVDQKSIAYINQCLGDRRFRRNNTLSFDFFHGANQGFEENKQWRLKLLSIDATKARILVKPGPEPIQEFEDTSLPTNLKEGFPFTLVKEGDVWKVDLITTISELQGLTLSVPLPAGTPVAPAPVKL